MNDEQFFGIVPRKDFDEFVELYDEFECPICDVDDPRFSQAELRFRRKLDELTHAIQAVQPSANSSDLRRALIHRARQQLRLRKPPHSGHNPIP